MWRPCGTDRYLTFFLPARTHSARLSARLLPTAVASFESNAGAVMPPVNTISYGPRFRFGITHRHCTSDARRGTVLWTTGCRTTAAAREQSSCIKFAQESWALSLSHRRKAWRAWTHAEGEPGRWLAARWFLTGSAAVDTYIHRAFLT